LNFFKKEKTRGAIGYNAPEKHGVYIEVGLDLDATNNGGTSKGGQTKFAGIFSGNNATSPRT